MDPFCSSPFWGVPLCAAFHPEAPIWVFQKERNLAVLVQHEGLLLPPDCVWMLGGSVFGPDPGPFCYRLLKEIERDPRLPRTVLFAGLFSGHPLICEPVWHGWPHRELAPMGRYVASLEGGIDGFLSRRSRNFRSRLNRSLKAALGGGLEPEFWQTAPDTARIDELWHRVLEIEKRSWKGLAGRGIDGSNMDRFYRTMLPLLAEYEGVRGLFLTRDGEDLAYLFGAVRHTHFRGLQFSYVDSEKGGLGNVCQYLMLEKLCEEGCLAYDLGQAMEYKARWADENILSWSYVVRAGR